MPLTRCALAFAAMLVVACTVPRTGVAPTCDDGVVNQGETDIDCGGTACAPCPNDAECVIDADCESRVCNRFIGGVCDPANTCGNGVVETGEACDDGNDSPDDGCDPECLKENGQSCDVNVECLSAACDTQNSGKCVPPGICGNGIVEGGEGCDTGDTTPGDGCDAMCLKENDEPCTDDNECASVICDDNENPDRCEPADTCGNGRLEDPEVCDDGNVSSADACDSNCKLGLGQDCTANAECGSGVCDRRGSDTCEPADICGNGVQDGTGESCDDGNLENEDGCSDNCLLEDGRVCVNNGQCESGVCDKKDNPNRCEPANTCGNGKVEGTEGCEDGNTANSDGCNNRCLVENGYECDEDAVCDSNVCDMNEEPPVCEPANMCGNGTVELAEKCDDGNTGGGDGCSFFCFVENGFECGDDGDCQSGVCDMTETPDPLCEPINTCGNGRIEPFWGEACDDGNVDNDDGCNDMCKLEAGEDCVNDNQCASMDCYGIGFDKQCRD